MITNILGVDAQFDTFYTMDPIHLEASQFIFYGVYHTVLYYETSSGKWIMKRVTDHEIFAVMNATGWPFGTQIFEKSDKAGGGSFMASLNICNDEQEFACEDGGCIPFDQRY